MWKIDGNECDHNCRSNDEQQKAKTTRELQWQNTVSILPTIDIHSRTSWRQRKRRAWSRVQEPWSLHFSRSARETILRFFYLFHEWMWLWCFLFIFHLLIITYLTNRHTWVIFYHYLAIPLLTIGYCLSDRNSNVRNRKIYIGCSKRLFAFWLEKYIDRSIDRTREENKRGYVFVSDRSGGWSASATISLTFSPIEEKFIVPHFEEKEWEEERKRKWLTWRWETMIENKQTKRVSNKRRKTS
jgi:hypothetical protein